MEMEKKAKYLNLRFIGKPLPTFVLTFTKEIVEF
jgi:hypothetical protein